MTKGTGRMTEVPETSVKASGGIIPTGMWVMDEARSRKLVPAALTLWVIRDDGDVLNWVSVETESDGKVTVNAYEGRYGGAPSTVLGNGFRVSLTSPGSRMVRVAGEVPDMGPFEEVSEISADGRQMEVTGKVETDQGTQRWYELFDWRGPSPHGE